MPDPLDTFRERAKPWLEPIPGPSPAGALARLDPVYEAVAGEVAKLDLPAGGEVNWKKVVGGAGDLLKDRSKDVVLAAYLAHALHVTGGLDGLGTGVTLVSELLDRYWDGAFPELKRIRGRANAVQWFIEKSAATLPRVKAQAKDAPMLEALEGAARRLAEVVRARFADAAPAMGPLLEAVQRVKANVEAAAPRPAPPPPPPPETAPTQPSTTSAVAPVVSPPAIPTAPANSPGSAEQALEYLRSVGDGLISAGNLLRSVDNSDPTGYRILRIGLWLPLRAPPPAEGGKTAIPPPPADLRAQLGVMAQNQKWNALLEESEAALSQSCFWLDLQRFSAQALAGLGSGHDRAREAIAVELRAVLARMPKLPSLAFSDGAPLADAKTKAWIEEEVAARSGPAPAAAAGDGGAADPKALERMARAKKLLAGGDAREALAELQALVVASPGGRARFRARLDLARACASSELVAVAKATYEELDREAVAHRLDEWEPALAAECLKGLIAAARSLAKDPRGANASLEDRYQRLCRLDPAAAHEVWP